MRKKIEPCWNVFVYNINAKRVEEMNVFDHWSFRDGVDKIMGDAKTSKDKKRELVKGELMYYFWCKAEYEVFVSGMFN